MPSEGSEGEGEFSDEPSAPCVMDINHPRGVAAMAPLADRVSLELSSFAFTTSVVSGISYFTLQGKIIQM